MFQTGCDLCALCLHNTTGYNNGNNALCWMTGHCPAAQRRLWCTAASSMCLVARCGDTQPSEHAKLASGLAPERLCPCCHEVKLYIGLPICSQSFGVLALQVCSVSGRNFKHHRDLWRLDLDRWTFQATPLQHIIYSHAQLHNLSRSRL